MKDNMTQTKKLHSEVYQAAPCRTRANVPKQGGTSQSSRFFKKNKFLLLDLVSWVVPFL
jgi:hypothetical protein